MKKKHKLILLLLLLFLLVTLRTTTTTNKMPITINAQKRQPICKWSGSDEPQSYYSREDDDTATLTRHQANYIRWYNAHDHSNWRNADDDDR